MAVDKAERAGEAARAFTAHFANLDALRCSASNGISGSIDDVARIQRSNMGIFYCPTHKLHHAYSFDKFRLNFIKKREAYMSQHRAALVLEGGEALVAHLIEKLNSHASLLFRRDRTFYSEQHQRVQREARADRQRELIANFGVDPELLDEFYTCYRKLAYPFLSGARQHMVQLMASDDYNGGEVRPYQCSYCTGWHVGHASLGDGEREVLNRREKAVRYLRKGRGEVFQFYAEKGISPPRVAASSRSDADE